MNNTPGIVGPFNTKTATGGVLMKGMKGGYSSMGKKAKVSRPMVKGGGKKLITSPATSMVKK